MDQPGPSGMQSVRNKRKTDGKSRGRNSLYDHVSKGAIKRLARRGGVKRISAPVYNEARDMLIIFLTSLLKDAYLYCEHSRRKTVTAADVVLAMKNKGQRLYGFDDPPFPVSYRSSIKLTSDTPSIADTQSTLSSGVEVTDGQTNGDSRDSDTPADILETTLRRSTRNYETSRTTENVEAEVGRNTRSDSHAEMENSSRSVRRSSRNRSDLETTLGNIESTSGRNEEILGNSNAVLENSDTETTLRRSIRGQARENVQVNIRRNSNSDSDATEPNDYSSMRRSRRNSHEIGTHHGDIESTPESSKQNLGSSSVSLENSELSVRNADNLENEDDDSVSLLHNDENDFDPYSGDWGISPITPQSFNADHE